MSQQLAEAREECLAQERLDSSESSTTRKTLENLRQFSGGHRDAQGTGTPALWGEA